jgi:hypothetical protein
MAQFNGYYRSLKLFSTALSNRLADSAQIFAMQAHNTPLGLPLCILSSLLLFVDSRACNADTNSKNNNQVLSGTVQDKEKMEASVKLLLAPPPAPQPTLQPAPINSTVEKFSGFSQYSLKALSPTVPMIIPHSNAPHIFQTGATLQASPTLPKPFARLIQVESVTPQPLTWQHRPTPRNGIMIWSPEYATKHVRQPAHFSTNTSLGYSFAPNHFTIERHAQASIMDYGKPSRTPSELQAVQQVLPVSHSAPPANWDIWYQKVARAIYTQWTRNTSLGAGKVVLQVKAYPSRNVDAKVIDYAEAPGVDTDTTLESKFREASLKAVTALDGADVWTFPSSSGKIKDVTFDMELNHAVGEAPGCSVVRMHTE